MARLTSETMRSRLKEMDIINPLPKRGTASNRSFESTPASRKKTSIVNTLKTGASMIPDLNKLVERVRRFPDDRYIYITYMLSKNSEYFTPYSLKEVSYADLPNKHQYFTMSRHGVTYWHLSENFFTPLTQWQQEFQQYLSIIKIRTFAIFRLWKGFKVWEKTVKWKKINEARQYLEDHLFIANPIIAETVLRLRAEIVNLNSLNFVTVTMIEEWHPFYFLELHMRNYEQIRDTLVDFHANFQDKIMSTCVKAIKNKGFFPDDEINYFPSVKKMREAMSFIDRAKKRNFCKLLSNFLSYCDHMMYGMLHLITTNSFRDLARALWAHDSVGPTIEMLEQNYALNEQIETARLQTSPQNPFFLAALQLLPDRIEVEPQE